MCVFWALTEMCWRPGLRSPKLPSGRKETRGLGREGDKEGGIGGEERGRGMKEVECNVAQ